MEKVSRFHEGYSQFKEDCPEDTGRRFCSDIEQLKTLWSQEELDRKYKDEWCKALLSDRRPGKDPREALVTLLLDQEDTSDILVEHFFTSEDGSRDTTAFFTEEDRARRVKEILLMMDLSEEQVVRDLVNKLPSTTIIEASNVYSRVVEEKQQEMKEKEPQLIAEAKEKMWKLVERENLPMQRETFDTVIASIQIIWGDPIYMIMEDDLAGSYKASTSLITISLLESAEDVKKILVHELFHALSGHMVMQEVDFEMGMEDTDTLSEESVYIYDVPMIAMSHHTGVFLWMNEGMTEMFTELTYNEKTSVYSHEKKIVRWLCDQELKEVIYDAYFGATDPQEQSKRLRAMVKTINEKYGTYFLQRLDKKILSVGVDIVAQKLASDSTSFVSFIMEA